MKKQSLFLINQVNIQMILYSEFPLCYFNQTHGVIRPCEIKEPQIIEILALFEYGENISL